MKAVFGVGRGARGREKGTRDWAWGVQKPTALLSPPLCSTRDKDRDIVHARGQAWRKRKGLSRASVATRTWDTEPRRRAHGADTST